ncbi:spore germination protein [Pseudobacteroides cellulosolvens]|uniref:GerA spore germination protein n=1 Tax=Pseudobacteroides cellulosolvens ATCC 35603 = DSM 2933 TaxID=398512 RepID=A0A0L6JSP3_9FIRM|nr:spore germination protein [Pseudobacteroides cellulosolvens]KNY28833.1 GerA spore germination protein [Pseudobacteroides cellulosolvens ATCC 35603 = DSM 2933]
MAKKSNALIKLLSYIIYKEKKRVKEFYIPEADEIRKQQDNLKSNSEGNTTSQEQKRKDIKKPVPIFEDGEKKNLEPKKADDNTITNNISENMNYIKTKFNAPVNKDIVIRELMISKKHKAFIAYIDGMIDKNVVNNSILRPLLNAEKFKDKDTDCQLDYILQSVLETNQNKKITKHSDVVFELLSGNTLLYVDGCDFYVSNETKGFPARGVEKPVIEGVIAGAQEAFNESLKTNIALVRKIVKNHNLTTEYIKVGERSQSLVAIMYINGITNPAIVDEVKRRLESLDIDLNLGDGMIEQLIEDNTFSIIPTMLATERPDRTAAHIVEGRVAIFCEGVPFVKIVPITLSALIHSPEDAYIRFPYGTLLRWIRLLGIFFAALLPGLYLAITNFHQEMIPTELLIAIAKAKENVPFPTIVEVILMELSFELIREAGIRIPGIVGNTLGIIGALILGQAAVQANIVSPVLIIVVAITGLGNFAVPNYELALGIRLIRFGFIAFGFLFGFYGIVALVMLIGIYLASQKSFGVPLLANVAPKTSRSNDLIMRYPVWKQERRPDPLNPLDSKRQPKISRKWTQEDPNYSYDREDNDD